MRFIISAIIFLIGFSAGAQVNQTDAKGKKQGVWEKVYPGTRVYIYRGEFKDDKPIGKFSYFYKSGKVKAIIEHEPTSGRSVGYFYHETGGVMSFGIYRNLQKDSIWTSLDNQGVMTIKETYLKDSLNGTRVVFYPPLEGAQRQIPSQVSNYKNGALDGVYNEYFPNAMVKVKGQYLNGKKQGVWETYHTSGKMMMLNRYKDGAKHGWCSGYDDQGKEIGKKYFYYGRLLEGKQLKEKMDQMKKLGINPNE